jgi:hypothetical protein
MTPREPLVVIVQYLVIGCDWQLTLDLPHDVSFLFPPLYHAAQWTSSPGGTVGGIEPRRNRPWPSSTVQSIPSGSEIFLIHNASLLLLQTIHSLSSGALFLCNLGVYMPFCSYPLCAI